MAELQTIRRYKCDLANGPHEVTIRAPLMQDDALADRFEINILQNGIPVSLAGATARGWLHIAAEQKTILLDGEIVNGGAAVTLSAPCYVFPGACSLIIQLMQGDVRHTVLKVNFTIARTGTENVIDPGSVLPALPDLLGQIAAMEQATAAARAAIEDTQAAAADTRRATQELSAMTAPPIISTATGEVITVSDSAERPLAGLTLYGKTTQSGTPAPGNPVSMLNAGYWGGIGALAFGKNLFPAKFREITSNGVTVRVTADGEIRLSGTASANAVQSILFDTQIPPGTYTLSLNNPAAYSGDVRVNIADADGVDRGSAVPSAVNSRMTFTADRPLAYYKLVVMAGAVVDGVVLRPQLELGSTASAFEAHKDGGSVYAALPNGLPGIQVSAGGNYIDSAGRRWLGDEINLGRGMYVKRVQTVVLDGSQAVTYDTAAFNIAGAFPADNVAYNAGLCSHYVVETDYSGFVSGDFKLCKWGNGAIRIRDSRFNDAAGFAAWLSANPVTLYMTLEVPVETALPDEMMTAYGAMSTQYHHTTMYNTANAGMAVDYIADTKRYIDQRIAALLNA